MNLSALERFAREARTTLCGIVKDKIERALPEQSAPRRDHRLAVERLERELKARGPESVVEEAAYTWFNRFCAFRFMDANRYTSIMVVSPVAGATQPEMLAEARNGVFDDGLGLDVEEKQRVKAILAGAVPSADPFGEAYRLLFVATCNAWRRTMPFLFREIDDWTEILMPDDLLSENSILTKVREAMTDADCQEGVEIIGWLYQFYIAERHESVMDVLKKKTKVGKRDIPAATQLFTPEWIVRYMTDNSLGRLWSRHHPDSPLLANLKYFIPDEPTGNPIEALVGVGDPQKIRLADTACGSGHILVYAFDVFYAMYEEAGFDSKEIPALILKNNLFGLEIDPRAAALASFALMMKARSKYRRFLQNGVMPNIHCFKDVVVTEDDLKSKTVQRCLQMAPVEAEVILHDLSMFADATSYGTLMRPKMTLKEVMAFRGFLGDRSQIPKDWVLFEESTIGRIEEVLDQIEVLLRTYHVVIDNPPYLGSSNMDPQLSSWLKENYSDVKSDFFSAFIVRNTELTVEGGFLGFMSPFVWMFISSYEKLRGFLIDKKTITSLIQLEYSGFAGATVPICTFTLENLHRLNYRGGYVRLSDFKGADIQGPMALEIITEARKARE